jgi:cytidylate kinase
VIVAIDGPAGAGKSTVARALAERLAIGYLNTGLMYRALAVLARRHGVDPHDGEGLARLLGAHELVLTGAPDGSRALVDGEDVTALARGPEATSAVSAVAAHGAVRARIVELQRETLRSGDWVADGRDIGSVVCPDADLKVFLTADPAERARRRHAEMEAAGEPAELVEVLDEMRRRDAFDSSRTESPLVVAPGAVVVDTSGLAVDEVVDRLEAMVGGVRG